MDELSLLRSELYTGRRALSALQQELTQASVERDEALNRIQALESSDLAGQIVSLQTDLTAERQARREAEATCTSLSHDRQRLQRARDELASNLLESQQRATELEDELVRADERLAAANKQLQQLQDSRAAPSPQPLDGPQAGIGSSDNAHSDQALPEQPPISKDQEALTSQVAQLKASRDKLLVELEKQFLEVDRLAVENAALSQGMEEVKEAAEAWEKQAQASLQQLDRLKDILEESAAWSGPGAVSRPVAEAKMPGQEGSTTEEGDGQEAGSESKDESRDLEKRYLQECAHVAKLESQLQSLCSELRKASAVRSSVKHVTLPALLGVESRLKNLVHGSQRSRQ
ncbi:g12522 [Coccomyxa viridis]|uniref:G12522 protein n=1 Tax=Coccomyxa viridis TaxID=1274662 RepID=A0ABP1GAJ5_9CHLO